MKGEKLQNIYHSGLLIMGGTRYLRTHGVKANLEPYRKSGNMKPFVILSMSWVVMQGATVAESERQQVKLPQVAVEACDGIAEAMSTHY